MLGILEVLIYTITGVNRTILSLCAGPIWGIVRWLCFHPDTILAVYDKESSSNKKEFIDLLGKCSISEAFNLDWWSASVSSRNHINSSLFFRFCTLILVKEEIETNKNLSKIILDGSKDELDKFN